MEAVSGMDECRWSQIVYTRDHAVLNISAYKKIRVQSFFLNFMKIIGTKGVFNVIHIVVYDDFS